MLRITHHLGRILITQGKGVGWVKWQDGLKEFTLGNPQKMQTLVEEQGHARLLYFLRVIDEHNQVINGCVLGSIFFCMLTNQRLFQIPNHTTFNLSVVSMAKSALL
jgi:hypothetical protein